MNKNRQLSLNMDKWKSLTHLWELSFVYFELRTTKMKRFSFVWILKMLSLDNQDIQFICLRFSSWDYFDHYSCYFIWAQVHHASNNVNIVFVELMEKDRCGKKSKLKIKNGSFVARCSLSFCSCVRNSFEKQLSDCVK